MWEVDSILCPTDFAGSSDETLRVAYQVARDRNARLITLHVVPKSMVSHVERVSELTPEQSREKLWEAMRRPRSEEAALHVEHRLEEGDPLQAILRVAEESQCELIVMGCHARSGWARWLMGGVAESVIQKAPCSVLVVKEAVGTSRPDTVQPAVQADSAEEQATGKQAAIP